MILRGLLVNKNLGFTLTNKKYNLKKYDFNRHHLIFLIKQMMRLY